MTSNKLLLIKGASIKRYTSQIQLSILINEDNIKDILLSFFLLKNEFIDSLSLKDEKGFFKLMFQRDEKTNKSFYKNEKENKIFFEDDQIDLLLSFLLTYYRDNISDVSHIDIDFLLTSDSIEKEFTLTIWIEHSVPPLSGDDVKQIFGID